MANLDRAKLLDWLGPDVDWNKYEGRMIPGTVVALQRVRDALKAGRFDVDTPEVYPRAKMSDSLLSWNYTKHEDRHIINDEEGRLIAMVMSEDTGVLITYTINNDPSLVAETERLLAEVERLQSENDALKEGQRDVHNAVAYLAENVGLYGGKGDTDENQ